MDKIKFAPKEIFEEILEWAVIPTFDLVIEYGDKRIIIVKRKIAPYKNQWVLPGLRMYKGEEIDGTLTRITKQEVGLNIDLVKKKFLGQRVGKFTTEHHRQDLSTGYLICVEDSQNIILNRQHFSEYKLVDSIPSNMGTMYIFYLDTYLHKN